MEGDEGPALESALAVPAALSDAEWAAIEDVPHANRLVGNMFAEAAENVRKGVVPPVPCWSQARWTELFGDDEQPTPPAGGKKGRAKAETKAARLKRELRKKQLAALREKASATSGAFPRLEAAPSLEAWTFAVLQWAQHRPRGDFDALVSLHRLHGYLQRACTGCTALQRIEELVAAGLEGTSQGEVLRRLAEDDSVLETHSFHAPGRLWPYADQVEICERLLAAVRGGGDEEGGLLLGYRTPPSGGKTAAAALLGAVLQREWEASRAIGRRFVLYTCFSNPVRVDVCRTLLSASVPFAVVTGCVASPSYRCYFGRRPKGHLRPPPPGIEERVRHAVETCQRCDRCPVVLVCDPASAFEFGRRRPLDVLVLDEIMAGTERAGGSPVLRAHAKLLREAPRVVLLASATLPPPSRLGPVVSQLERRHACSFEVRSVEVDRLPINFTALDPDGRVWAPHQIVPPERWADLAAAMQGPRQRHLQRFYAAPALLEIADLAAPAAWDLLDHVGLRRLALHSLQRQPRRASAAAPRRAPWPGPGQCCRREAHRWPGTTLIVQEPEDYVTKELEPLVASVPPLKRLLAEQSQKQRAGAANAAALAARNADEDGGRPSGNDGFPEDAAEDAADDIAWPAYAVINSRAHHRRHGGGAAPPLAPGAWRTAYPVPQNILETSHAGLAEALCAGAAVLGSRAGDRAFEASALTAADSRKLSHVVADLGILFGTNLAIDRVALRVETAVDLDAAALQQLCGRVGRTGKGVSAQVVLPAELLARAVAVHEDADDASLERLLEACGDALC
jgi:hypothetical protein